MKALIIGSGAREHALAWKFTRSNRISGLYVAPGNGGTAAIAANVPEIDGSDPEATARWASDNAIDSVFVGPEIPLAAGVVDALAEAGVTAIGPNAHAAQLESSKQFAKSFMDANAIPTASHQSFTDAARAEQHLRSQQSQVVVKKSGLAAGKGVLETDDLEQQLAFARRIIGDGDAVVVEERLSGYEVSVFLLLDGNTFALLPVCTDYKKAGVGGAGPNTGGMGALSPVPWLTPQELTTIRAQVIDPTINGLRNDGLLYKGVLYIGLMMCEDGPRVLEYNVRLGDPEAQVLLPLIRADIANICEAISRGELDRYDLAISQEVALGVVVAAMGYPGPYERGLPVTLPTAVPDTSLLFHAATINGAEGLVTNGGRCFTAVGIASEFYEARRRAYELASQVVFPGSWFRPDIGGRIFGE